MACRQEWTREERLSGGGCEWVTGEGQPPSVPRLLIAANSTTHWPRQPQACLPLASGLPAEAGGGAAGPCPKRNALTQANGGGQAEEQQGGLHCVRSSEKRTSEGGVVSRRARKAAGHPHGRAFVVEPSQEESRGLESGAGSRRRQASACYITD